MITFSCEKKNNLLEIGISDVLHKTFFLHKNCNTDFYYNVMVKNDSIFVDGKEYFWKSYWMSKTFKMYFDKDNLIEKMENYVELQVIKSWEEYNNKKLFLITKQPCG